MKNSEAGRRFREASGTGRRGRLCTPGNSQEGNPSHRNWQTKIGTTIKTHAHTHAHKNLCWEYKAGGIGSSGDTDMAPTWRFFLSDLWFFDFTGIGFPPDAQSGDGRCVWMFSTCARLHMGSLQCPSEIRNDRFCFQYTDLKLIWPTQVLLV